MIPEDTLLPGPSNAHAGRMRQPCFYLTRTSLREGGKTTSNCPARRRPRTSQQLFEVLTCQNVDRMRRSSGASKPPIPSLVQPAAAAPTRSTGPLAVSWPPRTKWMPPCFGDHTCRENSSEIRQNRARRGSATRGFKGSEFSPAKMKLYLMKNSEAFLKPYI